MTDELGEDLAAFRESARALVGREIVPHIEQWERDERFDAHALFARLAAQGFLGLGFDEADGGQGAPPEFERVFLEELSSVNAGGVALAISVQTHMATPSLAAFGSPELKRAYLRPALAGEQVAAIAVTEPDAGSDVAGLRTSARRDGDEWVISGEKTFITNGAQADWFCMLVRTSDEGGHRGMSQVIVPSGLPGFRVVRTLDKLGNRCSDTAELLLEEVRVPVSNTIGEIGRGFQQQMRQFLVERAACCFMAAGSVAAALRRTREYLEIRSVFGAPLSGRQYPVFRLTELSAELEGLKAINDKICRMIASGEDFTREATAGKLIAGRLLRSTADLAVQFHGGLGYIEENWTSRYFRDSRLLSIGGGADEVMLQVLSRLDSRS